jgi:N-acetylneuraminic acid mutarotase
MVGGLAAVLFLIALTLGVGGAASNWQAGAPLPVPRTEVAAAPYRGGIAIVGGFLADGTTTDDADFYDPTSDTWSRLPDLPVAVNHAMGASVGGKLYVVGGYGEGFRVKLRTAYVYDGRSWRRLKPMPGVRAAAGAAIVSGKLYVVGGVGPKGLAPKGFALDLRSGRWTQIAGPSPREHLAVSAAGGRIYAVAGRLAGIDTNLKTFEAYLPSTRRWTKLAPVPGARGGTGAAVAARTLVSVGGEEPQGTIRSVFGYDLIRRRWRRLADLPTPRHGLGVAAVGSRVYVIGGGTEPGLTVSGANESLSLP